MILLRRQVVLWWLVSAAAVAAVTAWIALRWHVSTQHESVAHTAQIKNTHEWLHANANLTNEQHGKLENLAAAAERELAQERGRLAAAEREVAAALTSGGEGSPALQAALKNLAEGRAALQRAVVHHYFTVCGVLDDAQRKAYTEWFQTQISPP